MYLKGAIEQVLKTCKRYSHHGSTLPLTDEKVREYLMESNQFAAKGLRGMSSDAIEVLKSAIRSVIVLAMATGPAMDDLIFVGIVGIIDPERPQVEQAVSQLKAGGVLVKMITGDAEKTAKAIGT